MPENQAPSPAVPSAVDEALTGLRTVLATAIREEQRRDQLTGLPNDQALAVWIQDRIDEGRAFWLAFIEVDRFKNINDKFGYEDADTLLIKLAYQLKSAAKDFFPIEPHAFRAHGDEFYLGGYLPESNGEEQISRTLDQIRTCIGSIRVAFKSKKDLMTCTVSIGWLVSKDLLPTKEGDGAEQGLTEKRVRGSLELAVATAKITRDKCVRFDIGLNSRTTVEGRSDCEKCRAKFVVVIEVEQLCDEELWCPSCGQRLARPHPLLKSSETIAIGQMAH